MQRYRTVQLEQVEHPRVNCEFMPAIPYEKRARYLEFHDILRVLSPPFLLFLSFCFDVSHCSAVWSPMHSKSGPSCNCVYHVNYI